MGNKWIIGLGADEHEYKIGDVTYIVTSHFVKPSDENKQTVADKLKHYVGGDFADLTADIDSDTIDGEYVCSAAGDGGRAEHEESVNQSFFCSAPQFAKANCPTEGGNCKCSRKTKN